MLRSIVFLLSGNSFFSVMSFLRNLIIARLLDIEDYGIAATFAVSLAIVEMFSNLGLKQMIVQDRQGDDPHMQATLQGFQLLRASVAAIVLFLLAHPLATFLGIPQAAWAYQVIAIVPFFNGLVHFDTQRMHRQMLFLPLVFVTSGPVLVSVLMIWPLFLIFGDYRVMLFAILVQVMLEVLFSHLFAERPFKLLFDREIIRRCISFGWPILANGAIMFVVLHGEKLVVGRELGMEELAVFAMGVTLSLTPLSVIGKSLSQFLLPQLSAAKDDTEYFNHLARVNYQAHLIAAVLFTILLAFLGPAIVQFLLGETFSALGPLLIWLGVMNAFRFFKGASTLAAFAVAHTGNALWGNIPRAATLPFAWYMLTEGADLLVVVLIGLVGEAVGFLISLIVLRHQSIFRLKPLLPTLFINVSLLGVLMLQAGLQSFLTMPNWVSVSLGGIVGILVSISLFVARDLRVYVQNIRLRAYRF